MIRKPQRDLIKKDKLNADAAVMDTAARFAGMFASMDDGDVQTRAADVRNVRIISDLTGLTRDCTFAAHEGPGDRTDTRRLHERHEFHLTDGMAGFCTAEPRAAFRGEDRQAKRQTGKNTG